MRLRSEHGRDHLPEELLSAARRLVAQLSDLQATELYRLASNARQGIVNIPRDWVPYLPALSDAAIDPTDRNHATALLMAAIPRALSHEKKAQEAAVKASRERLTKLGVDVTWGPSGKFVSTESSTSITNSAERFASSLDRLAKK